LWIFICYGGIELLRKLIRFVPLSLFE